MRKTFSIIVIVALIISVVGTGVIVFVETGTPLTEPSTPDTAVTETSVSP